MVGRGWEQDGSEPVARSDQCYGLTAEAWFEKFDGGQEAEEKGPEWCYCRCEGYGWSGETDDVHSSWIGRGSDLKTFPI